MAKSKKSPSTPTTRRASRKGKDARAAPYSTNVTLRRKTNGAGPIEDHNLPSCARKKKKRQPEQDRKAEPEAGDGNKDHNARSQDVHTEPNGTPDLPEVLMEDPQGDNNIALEEPFPADKDATPEGQTGPFHSPSQPHPSLNLPPPNNKRRTSNNNVQRGAGYATLLLAVGAAGTALRTLSNPNTDAGRHTARTGIAVAKAVAERFMLDPPVGWKGA